MDAPLYVLSGPPGAGKSSVADALMRRFERGVHIPMDELREWVVSGIAPPSAQWSEETDRQFRLARDIASDAATRYREADFAVAIADVLWPADVERHFPQPGAHRILLLPTLEETLSRNATRTNKNFDTAGLADLIRHVYAGLLAQDWSGWYVLNTTRLTLDETVEAIVRATGARP